MSRDINFPNRQSPSTRVDKWYETVIFRFAKWTIRLLHCTLDTYRVCREHFLHRGPFKNEPDTDTLFERDIHGTMQDLGTRWSKGGWFEAHICVTRIVISWNSRTSGNLWGGGRTEWSESVLKDVRERIGGNARSWSRSLSEVGFEMEAGSQ
jgi:hypothetical protein